MLKLRPACKDYLWGGQRLRTQYHIDSALTPLAEAWVLSCHPDGESVITAITGDTGGAFEGQPLSAFLAANPGAAGTNCPAGAPLPLLIKLIDAHAPLSIQVHPSDAYARAHGAGQNGKTELWYILDAEPGAYLYYGFERSVTKAEFVRRIADGTLTEVLHKAPVQPGDVFYIPAGTLHSIGGGILLAEVQQNSNITYRVYDYGRLGADGKPRALHIDDALAVTDLGPVAAVFDHGGHLARCPYFTVDLLTAPAQGIAGPARFVALLAVAGSGSVSCGGQTLPLEKGECIFVPAGSGVFSLDGSCRVLCATV